jgi:hypothetical protein
LFNKNGELSWDQKKYDKLSDAQKKIADNLIGDIKSEKTFNIIKVDVGTKIGDLTGQKQYVKGDDGKTKEATMADVGGAFTHPASEKVINNYIVGTSTDGLDKGMAGIGECKSLNIYNPNFMVFFHEVGGHDFYKYASSPSDSQQGGHTIDYENHVRNLNGMDLRAYDNPNHPQPQQ